MTETIPSQMSFSKLLSHTFPGIFPAIGIFMIIFLSFSDSTNWKSQIKQTFFEDWKIFIGAFGGLIFFGTIIGVIIDSIHHKIEDNIIANAPKKIKEKSAEVFKDLNNEPVNMLYFLGFLPLERFEYLAENYYSYVECELNLFVSFLFSGFIYSFFIFKLGFNLWIVGMVFFTLIFLSVYCFYSGRKMCLLYYEGEIDFIKGALEGNQKIKLENTNK